MRANSIPWLGRHVGLAAMCMTAAALIGSARHSCAATMADDAQTTGIFLPNQWNLRPVGQHIPLGDLPADMVLSPDSRYALIPHCGYGVQELRVIDLKSRWQTSSAPEKHLWHGCAFSADGKRVYASGGSDDSLLCYDFVSGKLSNRRRIALREKPKDEQSWYPSGIASDPRKPDVYVAVQFGNRLMRVDFSGASPKVETVAQFPDKNAFPYEVILHPSGRVAYVSLWGGAAVAEVQLADGAMRMIPTDQHPCEMLLTKDGSRLFVTCANTNMVDVIDTDSRKVIERLMTSLYPAMPPGSTPNALALSADASRLYVANADNNTLAVFDASKPGNTRPLGFIPTGWYPTAVACAPENVLLVVNGKGNGSMANPEGPQPGVRRKKDKHVQYIGGLLLGSLSFIDSPNKEQLAKYTAQAYLTSPLRRDLMPVGREEGNPIPAQVGGSSPIRYCVYIIKENRTYDQVFGDIKEGNGDPNLCLFTEEISPNHHALVREFVLLDNFYVESEVSADGHMWSTAAYATDFTEKSWPADYGGHADYKYPSEGTYPIGDPGPGYIWDRARAAGVSYRSYGEWVDDAGPGCKGHTPSPALEGHFNPCYSGWDLDLSDLDRLRVFLDDLAQFEKSGDFPRLTIVRLPNDHTSGSGKGKWTPRAYVAQNDLALGKLIEALSHSSFWKEMAVFVVEDDAQNGPDHVDAHRSVGMVYGPFVKRHQVIHTMYSTASMLRTMELILGFQPMSQFDAAARPMYACFTPTPDTTPYTHRPARISLEERNGDNAPMQEESSKLNFDREDSNPDVLFNEIIWKACRGADSEMPPPVRAAFIQPIADADTDD